MADNFGRRFGGPEDVVIAWGEQNGGGTHNQVRPTFCTNPGDWSAGSYQHPGHEAVPGLSLREAFRKAGYLVFLVDEAYTSKRCAGCRDVAAELGKFLERITGKVWMRRDVQLEKKRRKRAERAAMGGRAGAAEAPNAVAASATAPATTAAPNAAASSAAHVATQRDHPRKGAVPVEERTMEKVHGLLRCERCHEIWNRDHNAIVNIMTIVKAWISERSRPAWLMGTAVAIAVRGLLQLSCHRV